MSTVKILETKEKLEDVTCNIEGVLRATLFGQSEMLPQDNRAALNAALEFVKQAKELIHELPAKTPRAISIVE